ncbi:MAG: MFS transporter [Mycobacteriales bacterium]
MTDGHPDPRRTLAVVSLPAMSFSLSQTMLVPAFPELQRALHTSAVMVTWLLTSYLVSAAVCTPVMGRLGDMFGKRRMLLVSVAAFAVGSVVAALAGNVGVVIVGRIVQGAAGGMFPLLFGIIRDEFPPEKVGAGIGLVSSTIGIGSGVGLLLGGALVDGFGYPAIFWLGAAASLLSVVAIWRLVPESRTRTPGRVDVVGAAVLSVGLVLVLFGVSEGGPWGWGSLWVWALLGSGLLVLVLWLPMQARTRDALVDVTTLRNPTVLVTNVATLMIGFGMFGAYVLIPQIVESPRESGYGLGGTATHAGLLILPGSLSMLVFGPLSGSLGSRFGHRLSLVIGCVLSTLGLAVLAAFHGSDVQVLVFWFIVTIGIAFAFAAMPNLIVSAVPSSQTGQATGFNAVVRSVGSSVGTQLTAVLVASSAVGSSAPRDSGFTRAFLVCAAVSGLSAVLALVIPRSRSGHVHVGQEIGAAGLLPAPALAADRA